MPRHQTHTGDSTISGKLLHPCLVLLMMILIASCSSPGPPAPQETVRKLGWSGIALPESVAASSLVPASWPRIKWRRSSGALHGGRFERYAPGIAASDQPVREGG
jgi:hypothetical protein